MNHRQLACRRDRLVLETLQEWGTMDTEQLRLLFFPSVRVAQRRLQKLKNAGKVKRIRDTLEMPYCYYIKHFEPTRWALNWVRLWLMKRYLKSWESISEFDYAANVCRVVNTVTGAVKTYHVYHNKTSATWLDGENIIVVFDFDERRREAAKRIKKGILKTIEELRRELACEKSV